MKRYLFLAYSPALGTSLTETPVFEGFKSAVPDCQIAVAAAGIPYEAIRYNPCVDYVWKTRNVETDLIGAARDLRKAIRISGFEPDCVCTSSWNQRSKVVVLGYLAGRYRRAGFAIHPELLDRSLTYNPELSIIDNNLKLLSLFAKKTGHIEPSLFFSPAEQKRAAELLGRTNFDGPPLAVFATQGSGAAPTEWYAPRFAEVADFLSLELGFGTVFVGAQRDQAGIEEIRSRMKSGSVSLAGETDIPALAAVLARCDLAIGIDTGVMHVARAVKLPSVLLGSAHEPPHVWLPLNQPGITILRKNEIDCRHCGRSICKTRECMDEITTVEVKAAIQQLLEQCPPSALKRAQRTFERMAGDWSSRNARSSGNDDASQSLGQSVCEAAG